MTFEEIREQIELAGMIWLNNPTRCHTQSAALAANMTRMPTPTVSATDFSRATRLEATTKPMPMIATSPSIVDILAAMTDAIAMSVPIPAERSNWTLANSPI